MDVVGKSSVVGIGLPVFNNEKYIGKLLDSLLRQTFTDFVVYISDDQSTDRTPEICRDYSKRDQRIIFSQNKNNIGANANNRKVLEMATTEYFMFSRGHEILSDNLIEECLKTLISNEQAVLSFATTLWIDQNDNFMLNKPTGYSDTLGLGVINRCAIAIWGNWDCYYGMSKTEFLKKINANLPIIGNDTLSLFEKSLSGGFAHAKKAERYRRYKYSGETYNDRMKRYKNTMLKDAGILTKVFPLFKLPLYMIKAVIFSKTTITEKIAILFILITSAPIRYLVSKGKQI